MSDGMRNKFDFVLGLAFAFSLVFVGTFAFAAAEQDKGTMAKGVIVQEVVPQSQFNVTVSTDKTKYQFGELMHIQVRSDRAGYLTLYDIQPNGKVNVLYPNQFQKEQRIQANKTYSIPAPGADFRFKIGPPRGRDILWAVVSSEPGVFPLAKATEQAPFPQVAKDAGEFAKNVKGVTVEQKKAWGAGYSVFYIGEPLGGHVHIDSAPRKASIFLNGSYRGKTPMKIYDLEPGQYEVKLTKENFQSWTTVVRVESGVTRSIDKQLVPLPNDPTINSIGVNPSPSAEGQGVTFSAQASVPGQEKLSYQWTIAGAKYSGSSVSLTFGDNRKINWSLQVTSESGGVASTSGTHTIKNVAPSIDSAGVSPSPSTEAERVTFRARASDPGQDQLNYNWTIAGASYTGKEVSLTFNDNANVNWSLRVSDGDGGAVTATGTHTVKNVAPAISSVGISPSPSTEGQQVTFSAKATDPGRDQLTYAWTVAGTRYTGNKFSLTFNNNANVNWSLRVSDGDGGVIKTSGVHAVENVAPRITSIGISPQPSTEAQQVNFSASATDPGNDSLTYEWTIAGANYRGPNVSLTFNDNAEVDWSLRVTDGDGGVVESSGRHVVKNVAPSITSVGVTPSPSTEGQQVTFSAGATDPGQDQLNYTWTIAGTEYSGSNISLTFNDAARLNWSLQVTDGDGGVATSSGTHVVESKEPTTTDVFVTVPNEGKVMKAMYNILGFRTIVRNLDSPHGIACSPGGRLYVAETGANAITSFTTSGGELSTVKELSESPLSLTFGPKGNLFFTTDQGNVWRLDQQGSLSKIVPQETLVKGVQTVEAGTFTAEENPYDIAFIQQGKYAGDMIVSLASAFPNYGKVVRLPGPNYNRVEPFIDSFQITRPDGTAKTQKLRTPTGLATSRKGDVLVASFAKGERYILRFSSTGKFKEIFTENISKPNGLEIDWHQRIYATTASFTDDQAVSGALRRYRLPGGEMSVITRFGAWGIAICEN